ncbi:DUF6468 domain-containing protein [Roseibium sp.]|uniref:DUF6468 domain-containing protein n=1 Tax=Roseibium sp. TaxID=1936156 RepID=UPI003A97763D
MSPLPIGMIIEGLVAVLLLVTIGYCFTLNKRLQRLRADEETLRATISELMTATEIAERAILGLKATASEADQTLGARLQAAEDMSASLAEQVGEGEKIFHRISQIAEAARAATAQRDAGHGAPACAPQSHARQPYAPEAPSYGPQGYERQGYEPQGYAPQGHAPQGYAPEPQSYAQPPAAPAAGRRSGRADDIRSAAAEATARLERFRKRSEGAAA